jgi:hypothetical protein
VGAVRPVDLESKECLELFPFDEGCVPQPVVMSNNSSEITSITRDSSHAFHNEFEKSVVRRAPWFTAALRLQSMLSE